MKNSKIEWCDHSLNPWRGCAQVSPGCFNCYAETLSKRNPALLGRWGRGQPRVLASDDIWKGPDKWNDFLVCNDCGRQILYGNEGAMCNGGSIFGCLGTIRRQRVFCASLADWLDDEVPVAWFAQLLKLIQRTHRLDWLLLTKRPQYFCDRIAAALKWWSEEPGDNETISIWLHDWLTGTAPRNVWIGTSVEDQIRADLRLPYLLSIPARVRFLSCEPLLGPVNLVSRSTVRDVHYKTIVGTGWLGPDEPCVHWVIAGGESGSGARPMHPAWARSLRDQCSVADVPFFFKQWGEWQPYQQGTAYVDGFTESRVLADGPGATGWPVYRVGKKPAGYLLDGVEQRAFPPIPV